jgi:hypothetical protein
MGRHLPWFITCSTPGLAAAVNLISGWRWPRRALLQYRAGSPARSPAARRWRLAGSSPAHPHHKHAIADSMYWSNSWAGGVLIALAAASLAAVALRRPARS